MLNYRSFRRRWILLFIAVCACLLFLSNTLTKHSSLVEDDYEIKHTIRRQPFQWKPIIPDVISNNSTTIVPCRNSVQGKLLIVDERGYICNRTDLDIRGCCDITLPHISKHRCDTCSRNDCCEQFEFCVSCCLDPEKKPLLTRVLEEARQTGDRSLASVADHFELCLAKCRTSSQSVQHENSYRNPKAKFCYGGDPPELMSMTV